MGGPGNLLVVICKDEMDWIETTDWLETRSTVPLELRILDRSKNSLRQFQLCLVQFVCFEMLITTTPGWCVPKTLRGDFCCRSNWIACRLYVFNESYSWRHGQVDQSVVCSLFKWCFENSEDTLKQGIMFVLGPVGLKELWETFFEEFFLIHIQMLL